eukprot:697795-Rhodomonas_salina.1
MSGTDVSYGAMRPLRSVRTPVYHCLDDDDYLDAPTTWICATRCPVLTWCMLLPGAIKQRFGGRGTRAVSTETCMLPRMSATALRDVRYCPTRCSVLA